MPFMVKITTGISSYVPGFTLITKSDLKDVFFHLRKDYWLMSKVYDFPLKHEI